MQFAGFQVAEKTEMGYVGKEWTGKNIANLTGSLKELLVFNHLLSTGFDTLPHKYFSCWPTLTGHHGSLISIYYPSHFIIHRLRTMILCHFSEKLLISVTFTKPWPKNLCTVADLNICCCKGLLYSIYSTKCMGQPLQLHGNTTKGKVIPASLSSKSAESTGTERTTTLGTWIPFTWLVKANRQFQWLLWTGHKTINCPIYTHGT